MAGEATRNYLEENDFVFVQVIVCHPSRVRRDDADARPSVEGGISRWLVAQ